MVEFSVFDSSKKIVFHITEKSGYLSVFDSSKKERKAQHRAGHKEKTFSAGDGVYG